MKRSHHRIVFFSFFLSLSHYMVMLSRSGTPVPLICHYVLRALHRKWLKAGASSYLQCPVESKLKRLLCLIKKAWVTSHRHLGDTNRPLTHGHRLPPCRQNRVRGGKSQNYILKTVKEPGNNFGGRRRNLWVHGTQIFPSKRVTHTFYNSQTYQTSTD